MIKLHLITAYNSAQLFGWPILIKRIYDFSEGNKDMKDLLGGKGANLSEMANMGLRVPPGFTITTKTCSEFFAAGGNFPDGVWEEILMHVKDIEKKTGKKFGDPNAPLLFSVRSGAPVSMPGMMDTVLNLGMNDEVAKSLTKKTNDERFVYDAYRRFITMFADVVMHAERKKFEDIYVKEKEEQGVKNDPELNAINLKKVVESQKELYRKEFGTDFPWDPYIQLQLSIAAVFNSWNTPRAITYRKIEGIPDEMGTACTIQTMVFGNLGNDSGSGVLFTRNPNTAEKKVFGEILFNAQGEDVVAGLRTPVHLDDLKKQNLKLYKELLDIVEKLENHYKDMQDVEFTIESGVLYMLQTRSAKRTAKAAVNCAVDMVNEKLITEQEAILRVEPKQIEFLLHKSIDPATGKKPIARGLPASPGAVYGQAVFVPKEAEEWKAAGKKVILVRPETTPEDIAGMVAAEGIITSRGGMTSHAAIVARGIGKPAIVGCEALHIDLDKELFKVGDIIVKKGGIITLDGLTGDLYVGEVSFIEPKIGGEVEVILKWADKHRKLGIWANANDEKDAQKAYENGAEGIGLTRTERMFLGVERVALVREMIMADTKEERQKALDKLLPMQKADFKTLLKAMKGKPVQIRLLDPPLHEFMPHEVDLVIEIFEMEKSKAPINEIENKKIILAKVRRIQEANPMIGLRACRVGVLYPEIYETQTRAIYEAACELNEEKEPRPEIMIPGTITWKELEYLKPYVKKAYDEVMKHYDRMIPFKFGTMIEMPRAALTADELAMECDFFSFGTNDLTQTALGLSRDDAQGTFLPIYVEKKILPDDPFQTLDRKGVGSLVKTCVELARSANRKIKIGICGEHGGDPESIYFFHEAGLDYVSCSPYRIPVARLAAARIALLSGENK